MLANKCKGVGLIEVLVSLVVISIGVLGLLAMQTKSLQQSQENMLFVKTSAYANQFFARLKANKDYVLSTLAADETPVYEITALKKADIDVPDAFCEPYIADDEYQSPSANCSADELAASDLYFWFAKVHELDASATVVFDDEIGAAASSVKVSISFAVPLKDGDADFTFATRI